MNEWMNFIILRIIDRQNEWMNRQNEWMNERLNEWMNEWTDRQRDIQADRQVLPQTILHGCNQKSCQMKCLLVLLVPGPLLLGNKPSYWWCPRDNPRASCSKEWSYGGTLQCGTLSCCNLENTIRLKRLCSYTRLARQSNQVTRAPRMGCLCICPY